MNKTGLRKLVAAGYFGACSEVQQALGEVLGATAVTNFAGALAVAKEHQLKRALAILTTEAKRLQEEARKRHAARIREVERCTSRLRNPPALKRGAEIIDQDGNPVGDIIPLRDFRSSSNAQV